MAVKFQRNMGLLVLGIWLVLNGLASMVSLGLPPPLMAVLALVAGVLILIGYLLLPNLRIELTILLATVAYLPFVPMIFRYSRVLWIYFERWANPNF